MTWIISANSQIYNHAQSFADHGFIDWRQGNNRFNIGDTVYIYCTKPIKSIRYKCLITETDIAKKRIRNDKDYWIDESEYHKSLHGKYFKLELQEELESVNLSLENLLKNGLKAAPQSPIKIKDHLQAYIESIFNIEEPQHFPETISEKTHTHEQFYEGIKTQVYVNRYERNYTARKKCIEVHQAKCKICKFEFSELYGDLGKGFIHVHHITPLHTIGSNYKIDYEKDLIPVCPNCHAMLHRKINGKSLSVEELTELVQFRKTSVAD